MKGSNTKQQYNSIHIDIGLVGKFLVRFVGLTPHFQSPKLVYTKILTLTGVAKVILLLLGEGVLPGKPTIVMMVMR
jgi:hypothetical protein